MTHYIVWERSEEPTVDREKYVWYNEGICKIWDGFSWRIVNQTLGVLDESVIPLSIARKTDLMNLLRLLVVEGQIPNPDDPSNPIVGGDWVSRSDFEDELNKKVDKSEYNPFKEAVNGELIDHERRITALENDVDDLKDDVAALKNGGNSGGSGGGNQGGSGGNQGGNNQGDGNSNVGRTFLIYAKTAGENVKPYVPGPNDLKWNITYNVLTGSFNTGCSDGSTVTWSTNNGNRVAGQYTWISMGSFGTDGNMIGVWSDPFCITSGGRDGTNGRDGVDGTNIEFVFRLVNTNDINIALSIPAPIGTDEDDWHDNDWQDHPQGISPEYPIELVSYRKIVNENNKKWSNFSTPAIWAKWGEDGTDGDGVEYIFRIVNVESVEEVTRQDGSKTYRLKDDPALQLMPPRSETELVNGASVASNVIIADFQNDEWVPGDAKQSFGWDRNWTDDPLDVSSGQPFEFVSMRKWSHSSGTWGYFSEPVLWGKFAFVDVTGFTAFAFTRTDTEIGNYVPEGGSVISPYPERTKTPSNTYDNTIVWSDSVPSGRTQVWITTRIFGDGSENQGWTSPRRLSDTAGFNVEYSDDYDWVNKPTLPKIDGNPSFIAVNDEGFDESAWRTYCENNNLGTWRDDDTLTNEPMYMATCYKKSDGWSNWTVSKIKGEAGQNGRGIEKTIVFYKSFAANDSVQVPLTTSTVTTNPSNNVSYIDNWTSDTNDPLAELNTNLTKLWTFTRIEYTDSTVFHSSAACIRWYNDQMSIDYSEIRAQAEQQILSDLRDATTQLGQIKNTATLVTTEGGLTQLLNTYCKGNQTSFANFIADAAAAKINAEVAGQFGESTLSAVSSRLSAAEATLTNAATTADITGAISDARTEWNAADTRITNTVTKAKYVWVWENASTSTLEQGQSYDYGVDTGPTAIGVNESFDTYEYRLKTAGFTLKTVAQEMSAIQQNAGKISLLVGQNGNLKAGIQIIADATSESNGNGGSRIVLDADQIRLNGNVTTHRLETIPQNAQTQLTTDIHEGTLQLKVNGEVKAEFSVDANGDVILGFYKNNSLLYDLGPAGVKNAAALHNPYWNTIRCTKVSSASVAQWEQGGSDYVMYSGNANDGGTNSTAIIDFIYNPQDFVYQYEDGYWQIGEIGTAGQNLWYINPLGSNPDLTETHSVINGKYFTSISNIPDASLATSYIGYNGSDPYTYIGTYTPEGSWHSQDYKEFKLYYKADCIDGTHGHRVLHYYYYYDITHINDDPSNPNVPMKIQFVSIGNS